MQQFTSALISAGGHNHGKLRYFVDTQGAQNRTAKSYDQGTTFDSKDPLGMIIGEVSTEHTTEHATENAQNSNSRSNSGAECDPWKDWVNDGTSEGFDAGGM